MTMTNSEQGLTPKLQPAESIRRRWGQEWHRDGRDTIGYESAHNDVLDLCDAIDALTADRTALVERGDALYQAGMSDERDHQNALSRRVEEMHKRERNALIEANQQSDKDWLAMYRTIAQTTADAAEWELADDATLMEEFDPWDALRALVAERDALRERVDAIFDDGLEDFTERDLERYSQLSPPEMYRAMIAAQQRVTELEEWEDVPDGTYTIDEPNERIGFDGSDITLRHNGLWIRVKFDYKDVEMFLLDNWRIQRRKEADNE